MEKRTPARREHKKEQRKDTKEGYQGKAFRKEQMEENTSRNEQSKVIKVGTKEGR